MTGVNAPSEVVLVAPHQVPLTETLKTPPSALVVVTTSGPDGPCGPVAPVAPVSPFEPAVPCGPATPGSPFGPCGPVQANIAAHPSHSTAVKHLMGFPPMSESRNSAPEDVRQRTQLKLGRIHERRLRGATGDYGRRCVLYRVPWCVLCRVLSGCDTRQDTEKDTRQDTATPVPQTSRELGTAAPRRGRDR